MQTASRLMVAEGSSFPVFVDVDGHLYIQLSALIMAGSFFCPYMSRFLETHGALNSSSVNHLCRSYWGRHHGSDSGGGNTGGEMRAVFSA